MILSDPALHWCGLPFYSNSVFYLCILLFRKEVLKLSGSLLIYTYIHACIYHSQVNMMNLVLGYCDSDLKIQIKITTLSHIPVEMLSG